jgi:cell division protein ZipA
MDKELLRVVIIAFGLVVIIGMLVRHFLKNKKSFQGMMFFGNMDIKGKINEALIVHTENDDFDVVRKPKKKLIDTDELLAGIKPKTKSQPKQPEPEIQPEETDSAQGMFGDFDEAEFDFSEDEMPAQENLPEEPIAEPQEEEAIEPRFVAPDIIQFRVLAKQPEGFNGLDILKAFRIAQMEYGNLKIFERYDANHLVDFGVLCMSGSGVFPDQGMADFYTSGLVFFMQPALLDDAVRVFDDYLEAINITAVELDGMLLDHEKKPLTNATIKMIRQSL